MCNFLVMIQITKITHLRCIVKCYSLFCVKKQQALAECSVRALPYKLITKEVPRHGGTRLTDVTQQREPPQQEPQRRELLQRREPRRQP